MSFVYGVITLYDASFQYASTQKQFCNSVKVLVHLPLRPTTPIQQRHQA